MISDNGQDVVVLTLVVRTRHLRTRSPTETSSAPNLVDTLEVHRSVVLVNVEAMGSAKVEAPCSGGNLAAAACLLVDHTAYCDATVSTTRYMCQEVEDAATASAMPIASHQNAHSAPG
jgi:hypothetical protein